MTHQRTDDRRQKTELLSRLCRVLILSAVFCPLSPAVAAPPSKVSASYEIYKGGIKIGQVEEVFARENDRYTITSTTRAVGVLAIFKPGKIVYSSSGLVGADGLRPLKFSDLREGEGSKDRRAEFDWKTKQLTLIQPAQRTVVPLPDGTQDRLSAMYQFMFLPLGKSDALNFNMTNGGKLDMYKYRITPDQSVTIQLGTFKALYVASVPEAGVNRTELWLAVEHANFPYKLVITDKDGGQLLQVLSKFDFVP